MKPTEPIIIPAEVFTSELITADAKLFYGALINPTSQATRRKLTKPYLDRVGELVKGLEIAGFVKIIPDKAEDKVAPLVAVNGQRMHYDAKNNRVVADDE